MPSKRDPTEEALAELNRAVAEAGDAAPALGEGLWSKYPAVVAQAAALAGELELHELAPDLAAAYERLAQDPESLDPVCAAMKEIVGALFGFGAEAAAVYLHASKHVQLAGWDQQDVGAPLRGLGVQALVKTEHPAALTIATDMLMAGLLPPPETDFEVSARIGAAKALRALGSEAGAHVLRLKALAGDPSAEVVGECFGGMLQYDPAWLEAVAAFLRSGDEMVASMAALAIGEARPTGALDHLKLGWESQTQPDVREAILNAIASLRSDEAVDFLIELVKGDAMTAMQALTALTVFAASESVVSKVQRAAHSNPRREVGALFEQLF